ncbi:MAG: sensor histidine kinase [Candidatus Omnitrophota bacterium]
MQIIFFFYGLAFILMGIMIFAMPKRNDFLGIADDLSLVGFFGIFHGINEWVDLFILSGRPVDTVILKVLGAILLPLSFLFMAAFGGRVISKRVERLSYLKNAWIAIFVIWAVSSLISPSILRSGILARYLICFPGIIISAWGLSMAAKDCNKINTPKAVRVFAEIAVAALLLYSVLSGLVTPKAGFFPASLLNYDNFTNHIGFPVQLLRMILAIVLAVSFFCVTSLFERKSSSILIAGGIKRKTGFAIAATTAIAIVVSMIVIYSVGSIIIRKNVGNEQFEITRTLALAAAENIKGEVEDAETYATRPLWKSVCESSNRKYAGMDSLRIEQEMFDNDKRWADAGSEDSFIREYTSGETADSMRDIINTRKSVSEIFMTDKFGGLVFASGRATDFYQADEDWWQKTYNNGRGAVYFGPMEYDASSGKWGIAIAVPIAGKKGSVIGVVKVFIQVDKLFEFLNNFKVGTTGHALMVDGNGNILVEKDIAPLTSRTLDPADFAKLKNSASGYTTVASGIWREKRSIISICRIDSEALEANGVEWYLLISRSSTESLGLLTKFLQILFFVAVFFIPLTIPVGLFLGAKLSGPIDKLSKAANLIALGDLDQKIDIRTGDEIEQFAETFTHMIFAIKTSQNNIIKAKKDLQDLSSNQEALIIDRTDELSRAQEATLNILEDLLETKSNLEKYTKDLEEALRVKTDFIATVSHELRTPLAAIKEGIAIVIDGTAGPIDGRQKEFLEIAKRNVDRLTRLINDLLDFQKMESGRMEYDITKNDINAVAKEAADIMSTVAEGKGLQVKFDLDKNLPMLMFDKSRIGQVLTNLIGNAIRYTDTGSITVRTKKEDNLVKVSVEDTGIGIKKDDMAKLFQRFSQLEPVSDRRVGGTGLGLAISKEIIDRHKGKIIVDSKPGIGSAFSFFLPIQERMEAV